MEGVFRAKADYSQLDKEPSSIRLSSKVVHTLNTTNDKNVDVTYVNGGKAYKVRAKKCIMARYNSATSYLCPEMPEKQKQALSISPGGSISRLNLQTPALP
ncbi:MAG: spermidine dehydrogenase [Granulosicoccus sp.]|jgi:spermidine dehydrogenase